MYSAFTLGVGMWLLYGLALGAWPIIVANAITLGLAGAILTARVVYGRRGLQRG
jgi:MtN3 and saliva related transmembrane protein